MALFQPGDVIRDTYVVERFLGEGAFAEVYRVRHQFLGRQAMKVFKLVGMTTEETEQMLGEAVMLTRIGHPNIIRVFDANVTETPNGRCGFFTMEYVVGGSLENYRYTFPAEMIPIGTVVNVMQQVCRGIAVAHDATPPIIHRDIKPQNILVGFEEDETIRVYVSDFGLAKQANAMSLMVSARGTLSFKAPEVFSNKMSDSTAGDIWALGVTLYVLLTGQHPYPQMYETDFLWNSSVFAKPIMAPMQLNLSVNQALNDITLQALSIDPNNRFPNARVMLAELEKWKPGHMPSPTPPFQPTTSEAEQLIKKALQLAKEPAKLQVAIALMEQAFAKDAELRMDYEYKVNLWRRGITM